MSVGSHARVAFALVLALAAARYGHDIVKAAVDEQQIDFGAYYASTLALWSGRDPFDPDPVRRGITTLGIPLTVSPPTFAPAGFLVFLPFVALPYSLARLAWILLGQACLVVALTVLWRHLAHQPALGAAGLVVALNYQPVYEDVAVGNLNLVMLLLVTLGLAAQPPSRAVRAALPLSLAVNLKVHYAVLIPFLWWLGAPAAAWLTLVLALAWSGLALLVFGASWLPGYVHFLAVGSANLHAWMRNLSPHALLHRLFSVDGPQVFVDSAAVLFALLVAGAVLWTLRGTRGHDDGALVAAALAVAAIPLATPLLEEHHLTVLLFPLLFAIGRAGALRNTRDVVCLIGAAVLLASRYSPDSLLVFNRGLLSLAHAGKAFGAALLAVVIARLALKGRALPGD